MVLGKQFDDDFDVTVKVRGTKPTPAIPEDALDSIDKIREVAEKRPLPSGMYVNHGIRGGFYSTTLNDKEGNIIGSVRWNPSDGFTDKITMPRGHKQYVPHLMAAAWDRAEAEGHYGPAWSHTFSAKGERLMNKINPNSSGLPWAVVENEDDSRRPFRRKTR